MRTIAIINEKGGVGKTTSTINIGAALGILGKKVLLIDLDPQENLTNSLGFQGHNQKKTIFQLFLEGAKLEDVILKRDVVDIIPSGNRLMELQDKLAYLKKYNILKSHILNMTNYDYVLVDCPANLGVLVLNAMVAVDEIYITLQSEFLALQSMAKISKMISEIKKEYNADLVIGGVIATRYDKRKKLNNEVISNIKEFFGEKFFNTIIRENIAIAEAPSYGKTIFEYRLKSHGADDYMSLAKEIIERDNKKPNIISEELRSISFV